MKLLNKTNLYFLSGALLVFCVGGILFFSLFKVIIDQDLNAKLHERKAYVLKQMARSDSLVLYQNFSANTLTIKQIDRIGPDTETISDTLIYDQIEHRTMGFRQLTFSIESRNHFYSVHIRRALIEQRNLIKWVFLLEFFLFLALLFILAVINNQLSKRLWKPFYQILDSINSYKLDRSQNFSIQRNSISEFNELATTIETMTTKINHEYTLQKEFIENVSHETQTPLAIIRNRMEILMQSPGLTEVQLDSLHASSLAAGRLSKINEALLILSRIENRQFHAVEDVHINDLVAKCLLSFHELVQMKNIETRTHFENAIHTNMNRYLADMLIENLITNAIKHNKEEGGVIAVTIEGRMLLVSNTGNDPLIEPEKLFGRFVKSNQRATSLGLGLPIVKAICETYSISIEYTFENRIHKVRLSFPA